MSPDFVSQPNSRRFLNFCSRRAPLFAVLALAVLVRVAVAFYLGNVVDAPPMLTDQRSYDALGSSLVAGRGFSFLRNWYPFTPAGAPTSHWSFLESLWVAAVYAVFGPHPLAARLATAVLGGLLLPWLVCRLARRMPFADSIFAIQYSKLEFSLDLPTLSAFLAAVYFYFVLYAATLMTETFFICALLWSLERALALAGRLVGAAPIGVESRSAENALVPFAVQKPAPGSAFGAGAGESVLPTARVRGARGEGFAFPSPLMGQGAVGPGLLLGLSLGLATLFRQSVLPWVAVLFLWLLWLGWRFKRTRQAVSALLVAGLVMVAMIAPFSIRNYRVYGRFLLLNSNAGYAMYSAQHPMHGIQFREFDPAPLPDDLARGNEAQMDRDLMRRGIGFILAEPGRYILLSLSRSIAYFEFWPKAETSTINNIGRVGSFGLFLPFMLYGIYLALRRRLPGRRIADPGRPDSSGFTLLARRFDAGISSPLALVLGFMLFYSLMHVLTWAMPRYRLPVDAVALPFAALAVQNLLARLAARFWPRVTPSAVETSPTRETAR